MPEQHAHDAVLVCDGTACAGADGLIETLRPVVRSTPAAVLVRTACLGRCGGGGGRTCVVLQATDAQLRPVGAPAQVLHGEPRPLTTAVASWLLRVEA